MIKKVLLSRDSTPQNHAECEMNGQGIMPATLNDVFLEGAARVTKVIDGSENYEAIIGHKVPEKLRNSLAEPRSIDEFRSVAIEYIFELVSKAKPNIYIVPDVDVLYVGNTKNNLREFSFLQKIIDQNGRLATINLSDVRKGRPDGIRELFEMSALSLKSALEQYFHSRDKISISLIYQIGQFAAQFVRYILSFQDDRSPLPGLAVVANDHSTNQVACSAAMKFYRVPRLYIQHAEVAPTFPPLDFEYTVLRNKSSLRTYEEIGAVSGQTFIISRASAPFVSPSQIASQDGPQDVVVYTTGRVELDGLSRVMSALSINENIRSLRVKPHPNQMPIEWPPGVDLVQEGITSPHIALVGNSSVVIELLARGVAVFQNFDFDPVEDDYYGFVSEHIVERVPIEALTGRFWETFSFDQGWYEKFSDRYTPTAEQSEAEAARLVAALQHVKETRWRPRHSTVAPPPLAQPKQIKVIDPPVSVGRYSRFVLDLLCRYCAKRTIEAVKYVSYRSELRNRKAIQQLKGKLNNEDIAQPALAAIGSAGSDMVVHAVASSHEPLTVLVNAIVSGLFSQDDAIRCVDRLHAGRHPCVYAIFRSLDDAEAHTEFFLWLAFKRLEVSGAPLPYNLGRLLDTVFEVKGTKSTIAAIEGMAFNACLRLRDNAALERLLEQGRFVNRQKLSTTRKVAHLRFLAIQAAEQYEQQYDEYWKQESSFHRLKLIDADRMLHNDKPALVHEQVEFAFATSAPPTIIKEAKEHIFPTYDRIRSAMRYMDVRYNNDERNGFQKTVEDALRNGRPLSMIRLGDGEGYAFAGSLFTEDDQKNRERHWWGVELDADLRAKIALEVRDAIADADILGIPSIYRFIRDTLDKSVSFKTTVQGRGLLQVLSSVSSRNPNVTFGEERMNLPLFKNRERLEQIVSSARECVLVSSSSSLPDWLQRTAAWKHVMIPTHQRTAGHDRYSSKDKPLPFVYEEIRSELESKVTSGTLVLVAGGLTGKILINAAMQRGGVALDIGSIMDEWLETGIHSLY